MNNVPKGAALLLAFIAKAETGRSGDAAYRTIIGHNEGRLPRPITSMTVDEVLTAQKDWPRRWRKLNSSAAGAYQIIRPTLLELKKSAGLSGNELFDAALQDRLGFALLRRRGWDRFVAGQLGREAFALRLAREWASLPVTRAVKGHHGRKLKAGQSFYDGDGVNSATVSPTQLLVAVDTARRAANPAPAKAPASQPEKSSDHPVKGDRSPVVARIQEQLRALGYVEVGNVDGVFGDFTENAILIFQKDHHLPMTGRVDDALILALSKARPRLIPGSREGAAPDEIRDRVPESKASWWSKVAALWGFIVSTLLTVGGWLVENLAEARTLMKPVTDLLGSVPWWLYCLLLAGGFLLIWHRSRASEVASVEAYIMGARR